MIYNIDAGGDCLDIFHSPCHDQKAIPFRMLISYYARYMLAWLMHGGGIREAAASGLAALAVKSFIRARARRG